MSTPSFFSSKPLNGFLRDWLHFNAGRLFFLHCPSCSFGGKLRLAVSAGASFDPAVARDFHRLGFTILQGYGLTETSGAATITRFEDNTIGSVGTPLNGVEVRINEPNEVGIGEVFYSRANSHVGLLPQPAGQPGGVHVRRLVSLGGPRAL